MEESENNSSRASQGEVDITGRVLQVDIRAGTFEIWPDGEEKITAAFTGEQGSKVLNALVRHSDSHTQVFGQGEYIDGKLKRIVRVDTIRTIQDKAPATPTQPESRTSPPSPPRGFPRKSWTGYRVTCPTGWTITCTALTGNG